MISVVIPALNEEKNIGRCLSALAQQDTTEPLEVIVVDNGSSDGTKEVVASHGGTLNVRVIHEPQRGRGAARRAGFAAAKGDVIFSTDADSAPPSNWIRVFTEALRPKDVVVVTGLPHISDCHTHTNRIFNTYMPFHFSMYRLLFGHCAVNGFCFAIKRHAYDAIGGFNPHSDAYEDLELGFKLHRQSVGKIKLVRHPRMSFSGRRFQRGFLRGSMEYLSIFVVKFIFRKERVILKSLSESGDQRRKTHRKNVTA